MKHTLINITRSAIATCALLSACSSHPVASTKDGGITLDVSFVHAGADNQPVAKAAGASQIEVILQRQDSNWRSTFNMKRSNGRWRCELNVHPATYAVMVVAYESAQVRWSGGTSVTVAAGSTTRADISLFAASGVDHARILSTNECAGCDLRGANLQGLWLREAALEGAVLDQAVLALSHLQYANLHQASLRNAYLIGASIRHADLRGADLRGANLSEANFTGADLRQADLRSTDLLRVVFNDANMEGARLEGANLAGATFVGARLGGAVWADGSTCPAGRMGNEFTSGQMTCN